MTEDLRAGASTIAPVLLGAVPFGLAAGAVTVEAGYGVPETIGHSVLIFAGASQIAAVSLLGDGAGVAVVVLTVLVINLRMLMYAASLAPYLAEVSLRRRLLGAYLLTDQAFAVAVDRFQRPATPGQRWRFYLGAAITLWAPWQVATALGAALGTTIPEGVPLGFAVPLMFLALLVPTISDRPTLAAAVTSATLATLGAGLPSNLGMLLGAFAGIGVGATVALIRRPAP